MPDTILNTLYIHWISITIDMCLNISFTLFPWQIISKSLAQHQWAVCMRCRLCVDELFACAVGCVSTKALPGCSPGSQAEILTGSSMLTQIGWIPCHRMEDTTSSCPIFCFFLEAVHVFWCPHSFPSSVSNHRWALATHMIWFPTIFISLPFSASRLHITILSLPESSRIIYENASILA